MKDALRFESVRVGTIRSTYWVGLTRAACSAASSRLGLGLDTARD